MSDELTSDEKLSLLGKISIAILAILAIPAQVFVEALIVSDLWRWFITPAFGIAVPSLALVFGVDMAIFYVTTRAIEIKKGEYWKRMGWWASRAFNVWIVGWVIQWLVNQGY